MMKGQRIEIGGKTPYQKWIESQGIPILREFYLKDLRKVERPGIGGAGAAPI
jgi:hypothetical protein